MKLTGAEVMVKCLQAEGVSTIFGYPGGAILPFYDALRDETSIRHILTAHEQGAAHAADGYARASGTAILSPSFTSSYSRMARVKQHQILLWKRLRMLSSTRSRSSPSPVR